MDAVHTVKEHFDNRAPEVKSTYAAILKAAKQFGPVKEEAKKTSIHLVRKSAFAGVATRKTALILTLKSDADVTSNGSTNVNKPPHIAGISRSNSKRRIRLTAKLWPGSRRPTTWPAKSIWSAVTCHRFGIRRPVAVVLRYTLRFLKDEPTLTAATGRRLPKR